MKKGRHTLNVKLHDMHKMNRELVHAFCRKTDYSVEEEAMLSSYMASNRSDWVPPSVILNAEPNSGQKVSVF